MTLPVLITPCEGQFAAALAGMPEVRGVGASRDDAVAALRADVLERSEKGELVWLEIDTPGVLGLAGRYADDPTLRDIRDEIYRQRDAEMSK
jgi:hypothetical protein